MASTTLPLRKDVWLLLRRGMDATTWLSGEKDFHVSVVLTGQTGPTTISLVPAGLLVPIALQPGELLLVKGEGTLSIDTVG